MHSNKPSGQESAHKKDQELKVLKALVLKYIFWEKLFFFDFWKKLGCFGKIFAFVIALITLQLSYKQLPKAWFSGGFLIPIILLHLVITAVFVAIEWPVSGRIRPEPTTQKQIDNRKDERDTTILLLRVASAVGFGLMFSVILWTTTYPY